MAHRDILALNKYWEPHDWIHRDEAIIHEVKGHVIDRIGEEIIVYRGGFNAAGVQSIISTNTIIVIDGVETKREHKVPGLTNASLFQRDRNMCAYCGGLFTKDLLTRDHIHPTSKGGRNIWMNCVTACKGCNNMKGDMMPGELFPKGTYSPQGTRTMDPLYVPYIPCRAEAMIMRGRTIKADQMAFLLERIKDKANSRVYRDMSQQLTSGKQEFTV